MADGYARATGKPGVVLVTSGPGATNTVTGILTAQMDSVPMIVLTGQTITPALGKDAFQEADVYGITAPIVKHSYLVKDPNEIPRVVEESFHITSTGRPGPVLIDLPKDVTSAPCSAALESPEMDLPGYTYIMEPKQKDIKLALQALAKSQKPLLLAGHGAMIANAELELLQFAETLNAPVVNTLLGKGVFPENHTLSLGMLGMHGTAYANKAISECDLIFSIGSRWDDRITPANIERFCPNATKIHLDIDKAEINKIVNPDVSIVGDAKIALAMLNKDAKKLKTDAWIKTLNSYKKRYPLKYKIHGGLKAQHVLDVAYQLTEGNAIVTTDVGQHQMGPRNFTRTTAPTHGSVPAVRVQWGMGFPPP